MLTEFYSLWLFLTVHLIERVRTRLEDASLSVSIIVVRAECTFSF